MNDAHIPQTAYELVPEQENIRFPLPVISGNVDYEKRSALLSRIDEILRLSGVEKRFIVHYVEQRKSEITVILSPRQCEQLQRTARHALRCSILRSMSDESYRSLSVHIADSPLLQGFIGLATIGVIRVPSKSTLERYFHSIPESTLRELVAELSTVGTLSDADGQSPLNLAQPVCMDVALFDSTCVQLDIHFPTDWVLLRDGVKSLIQSIQCIRTHGIRHRMPDPKIFLKKMNNFCIDMTHAKNKTSSKRDRKSILRSMKKLAKRVVAHAQRYDALLAGDAHGSALSDGERAQILARMENIITQMPAAIGQAHERIIGERQVKNKDKIHSLYEPHAQIYKRGKSGAHHEFGLQLQLVESMEGLIMDWELINDIPKHDAQHLKSSLARMQASSEAIRPKVVVGDRGYASKKNSEWLCEEGIEDALCPCSVKELAERLGEESFRFYQNRRSQTEGRIGILKANFLGRHLPAKGFERQERHTAWCIFSHNLWVLARLPQREESHTHAHVA